MIIVWEVVFSLQWLLKHSFGVVFSVHKSSDSQERTGTLLARAFDFNTKYSSAEKEEGAVRKSGIIEWRCNTC